MTHETIHAKMKVGEQRHTVLHRADLVSDSRQNKNAGNVGDLLKHSAYLALLHELTSRPPWSDEIGVVEAHAGKGVYAATHDQLRKVSSSQAYLASPLGVAQTNAFAGPPIGLGPIADLHSDELAYAGSAVLHAFELARINRHTLTLMDHDAAVHATVARVFQEPALGNLAADLGLTDPGTDSETYVLRACDQGEYSGKDVLHFDPFAFVMGESPTSRLYKRIVAFCDSSVVQGELGAATLFITWGSNNLAALDDLDGAGYQGGLMCGYRELVDTVDRSRRVILTWCWELYFSLIAIVPAEVRSQFLARLTSFVLPFESWLKRLAVE